MATVYIEKIPYADNFELNNIKETYDLINKKWQAGLISTMKFETIVKAMTDAAVKEFNLNKTYEETYHIIYDEVKGYKFSKPICPICKKRPASWNDKKLKYNRLCGDVSCIKIARDNFTANMQNKLGVTHLADNPEHQKKMLAGRGISQEYTFADGKIVSVVGKQEYKVVEKLEKLGFKSDDIEIPGPVLNYYHPVDKKNRTHIVDMFIPSLNLLISCKDGAENPNGHPNMQKDRLKSLYEYIHILNNTDYNFIQVEGDADIQELDKVINKVKDFKGKEARYLIPPRVDLLMYNESPMLYDKLRFYFLTDTDGKILISWFSADRKSNRGFIIYDDGIGIYDFTTILTSDVAVNLFYIDIAEYDIFRLRVDKVNFGFTNNFQALSTMISGIIDTRTNGTMYLVDIRDITRNIKSYTMEYADGVYLRDVVDNINRNENEAIDDSGNENVELGTIFTKYADSILSFKPNSYIYFDMDNKNGTVKFMVFDMYATIDSASGVCKIVRKAEPISFCGSFIRVERRFMTMLYAAMMSNIGIHNLLRPDTFNGIDIKYDVSDMLYILINNLVFDRNRLNTCNTLIELEISLSVKDISRTINNFRKYRVNEGNITIGRSDAVSYTNDDIIEFNRISKDIIGKGRNKAVKQLIKDMVLLNILREFGDNYTKTNKISVLKLI